MNVIQAHFVNARSNAPRITISHNNKTLSYEIPGNVSGEEMFISIIDEYIGKLRNREFDRSYDGPYSIGKLKNGDYVAVFHDGRMK